MNELDLQRRRIDRLRAAIQKATNGNVTAFGKRLGYKDGAYIRQMLSGVRPIREKTVFAVEELPGLRGFFSAGPDVVMTGKDGTVTVVEIKASQSSAAEAQTCRYDFGVALDQCERSRALPPQAAELIRSVVRASVANVAPAQFAAVRQILDGLTAAHAGKLTANPSIESVDPAAELPSDQDVDDAINSALPGVETGAATHDRARNTGTKRKSG